MILFLLLAAATIHTTPPKLYMNQEAHATIELPIPPGEHPDPFVPQSLMPSIAIKEIQSRVDDDRLRLSVTFEPKQLGRCIFAPGFVTFSPSGKKELLPATSVDCMPTGVSSLVIPQALPLYPEKKVTLSTENRLLLFNNEQLERVRQKNMTAIGAYETAWNMLAASLIIIACSMLLFWALVQYELIRRAKAWLEPKEDPFKKKLRELRALDGSLQERWHRLVQILLSAPLSVAEKNVLSSLLIRAEAISYGLSPTTEEEWQAAVQSLYDLLPSRLL